jgi:hypothetical protein
MSLDSDLVFRLATDALCFAIGWYLGSRRS